MMRWRWNNLNWQGRTRALSWLLLYWLLPDTNHHPPHKVTWSIKSRKEKAASIPKEQCKISNRLSTFLLEKIMFIIRTSYYKPTDHPLIKYIATTYTHILYIHICKVGFKINYGWLKNCWKYEVSFINSVSQVSRYLIL